MGEHALRAGPEAAWLRQVERHLRTTACQADAYPAVPVPLREPARQFLRERSPELRQDDWWQGPGHLRRVRVIDIQPTRPGMRVGHLRLLAECAEPRRQLPAAAPVERVEEGA